MNRIHFIAIGGAAMHNLALALKANGYKVTGSDDEIYEPSLSRLKKEGLLPENFGWFPDIITQDIDMVILGMHAKIDNPELLRAQSLGLKVVSYPEFLYEVSKSKKRIVVAGSHGKTTTTSMIIHVLKHSNVPCDYLVGAQLEGFDRMVSITNAPTIVIEGDEYLSSPLDSRSKFEHYKPNISVITGISWDHINVFPTEEDYNERFRKYIASHANGSKIFYYNDDAVLKTIIKDADSNAQIISYQGFSINEFNNIVYEDNIYPFELIGQHNLANAKAAHSVCMELGVSDEDFFNALFTFKGAGKRLQKIFENEHSVGFLDFAHAPSKVKATTQAIGNWYPNKKKISILELHTYSSLNKQFLPQYLNSIPLDHEAVVFFSSHTLQMKGMPDLSSNFIKESFGHKGIKVFDDIDKFHKYLDNLELLNTVLLLMTSGNLGSYDLNKFNRW